MLETKILDIIPENLKEKLISEVEDLIKTRKKEADVKTSNEVSPEMRSYLKAEAEARSKKVNETIKR